MILVSVYYMTDQFTNQNLTSNNFISIKLIQSLTSLFYSAQLTNLSDIFDD